MKKYLLMLAALFVGAVCFTSCGDDDDEINFDDVKPTITINSKGNPLTMTIVYAGLYTETHKATFDSNDMCSSYIVTEEYKKSALADLAWAEYQEAMDEDEDYTYSRKGNTITIDMSSDFKGKDKQYVLMVFDVYKANIEREYND